MTKLSGLSLSFAALCLHGCSSLIPQVGESEISAVVENSVANLVFVEGGAFPMGDVGTDDGDRYIGFKTDSLPVHEVELSSYSISKYETTWEAFNVYLRATNRIRLYEGDAVGKRYIKVSEDPLSPYYLNKPARVPAYIEAEGFCTWLAEQSGVPFALPTEAQWEYAARSRGKNIPYATGDGTLDKDPYLYRPSEYIDPSTPPTGNALTISGLEMERRSVGSYPPNELGIYDMTGNVAEWTQDWYQADYYAKSPRRDPKGPLEPTDPEQPQKVVRDWGGHGDTMAGFGTVFGRGDEPISNSGTGFRCVVNQGTPVN